MNNKTKYETLNLMLDDMKTKSELYRPTVFWEEGSRDIIEEINEYGVDKFRTLVMPRRFFVPSYSYPNYFLNRDIYLKIKKELSNITTNNNLHIRMDRLLSGELLAFNDFKILKLSEINKRPYLDQVSESNVGEPLEQYTFGGRNFSRSFLNYLLGLCFLKNNVDTSNIKTVMEIGGGYGTLGEILLGDKRNDIFYLNVDIPPVSFISSYYLKEIFGKDTIADYKDLRDEHELDLTELKTRYKALNLCSWQVEKLKGKIDLFVNFISFQEMEPEVVSNYFENICRLNPEYILLRNMKEGKKKKDENTPYGVENPITSEDYDKFIPNYKLVSTDSEIFGFKTEDGFHSQLRIYRKI